VLRNYFLINLILLVFVLFLSPRFYKAWVRPLEIPERVYHDRQGQDRKGVSDRQSPDRRESVSRTSYDVIVQRDLFRPSRAAFSPFNTTHAFSSMNEVKLFGTVIMNGEKSAILQDPATKITKLYRINDSVAGYIIVDIQEDRVVLLKDGESMEVKLRAEKAIRLPRARQPMIQPRRSRDNVQKPSRSRAGARRPSPARQKITPPPMPEEGNLNVQEAGSEEEPE